MKNGIINDMFLFMKNIRIKDGVLIKVPKNLTGNFIIPEGVVSIGDYAFYNCQSLTSIEIPESVTSIGNGTFSNCQSLTSIEIPESVTSIGNAAFCGCKSLKSIKIPESVTSIGNSTFSNCQSLKSIKIPESVTSIGNGTFYNCQSLTSIEIPESVTSIGNGTFSNCQSLTSIEIPESVTKIGENAFSFIPNLTFYIKNPTNKFIEIINRINKKQYTDYKELYASSDNIREVLSNESIRLLNCENEEENNEVLLKFEAIYRKTREPFVSPIVFKKLTMEMAREFDLKVFNRFASKEIFLKDANMKSALTEIIGTFGLFKKDKNVQNRINYLEKLFNPETYNYKLSQGSYENLMTSIDVSEYFEEKQVEQCILKPGAVIPTDLPETLKSVITYKELERFKKLPNGSSRSIILKKIDELYTKENVTIYDRKKNLSKEKLRELYEIMIKSSISGHVNYDSIHRMFDGLNLNYDEEICNFVLKNLEEIIENEEMQSMLRRIVNRYYEIKEKYITCEELTLRQCVDYVKEVKFIHEEDCEDLAKQATVAGVESQEAYDFYQKLYKKMIAREKSSLVRTPKTRYEIDGQIFECELLRSDDPFAMFVGERNYTDCCQRYHWTGHNCMVHSVASTDGGVFVVKLIDSSGSGKLLTQSWVWQNEQVYCYDNVEATKYLKDNFKLAESVRKVYKLHSDSIIKKSNVEILEYASERLKTIESLIVPEEEKEKERLKVKELIERQTIKQAVAGEGCDDIALSKSFELLSGIRAPKGYGQDPMYDMVRHGAYRDSANSYLISGKKQVLDDDPNYVQEPIYEDEIEDEIIINK